MLTENDDNELEQVSVLEMIDAAKQVLGNQYHDCEELKKKASEAFMLEREIKQLSDEQDKLAGLRKAIYQ